MSEKAVCIACEKEKPLSSFDPSPAMAGGRCLRCRSCVTKRYKASVKRMGAEGVPDLRHDSTQGKLSPEDVREIVEAHSSGEATYRELAEAYPVSKSTIASICREARKNGGEL